MPTANPTPTGAGPAELPDQFVRALRARFGDGVVAILLYGSWLRGKRDTILDFYVLLDDYAALGSVLEATANRLLAPNVYHISLDGKSGKAAAKYATLTLERFERAMAKDFHSYFWARFAQPASALYVRDAAIASRVEAACATAGQRMVSETLPLMDAEFAGASLWQRALTLTYGCELRSEDPSRAVTIAADNAEHFAAISAACLTPAATAVDRYLNPTTDSNRHAAVRRWRRRAWYGKAVSAARLLKAALTFNDPLDYVLWKVERHTGIVEPASELQRRYPLIFAWPVLWRLYRRGGFR